MAEKMSMVTDQFGVGKDLIFEPESEPTQQPVELDAAESVPQVPSEVLADNTVQAAGTQETQPEIEQKPVKETRNASNFRALKAEAAKMARERDEMKALVEQYQRQQQSYPQQQVAPGSGLSSGDDFDIEPDAYAEGKHLKTLAKQLKELKQENERIRQQTQGFAIKAALKSEHPDFDSVVTPDNLKALEISYPHLAKAINMNDPYNAGKACYDLIKQFGLDNDDAQESEITKAVIASNMSKPKPAAAVKGVRSSNETAMGRASEFYNGELTDQMKKQFYKELQESMKGYGGYKP